MPSQRQDPVSLSASPLFKCMQLLRLSSTSSSESVSVTCAAFSWLAAIPQRPVPEPNSRTWRSLTMSGKLQERRLLRCGAERDCGRCGQMAEIEVLAALAHSIISMMRGNAPVHTRRPRPSPMLFSFTAMETCAAQASRDLYGMAAADTFAMSSSLVPALQ